MQAEFPPGSIGHSLGGLLTSRKEEMSRAKNSSRRKVKGKGMPSVRSRKLYAVEIDPATGAEHVLMPWVPGASHAPVDERRWMPLSECSRFKSRSGTTYYVHGTDARPARGGFVLSSGYLPSNGSLDDE